jgi:hypothetical protein
MAASTSVFSATVSLRGARSGMKQTTVSLHGRLIQRLFTTVGRTVGWWTRLEYEGPERFIEPPALIVANHGFGGIFGAKMRASVLDPIKARSNETANSLAERVEKAMQAKLEEQTKDRVPFVGFKWSEVFEQARKIQRS